MRLNYRRLDPSAYEAMNALERYVRASGLEPRLLELVKVRVSQMNGCAYCLDLHSRLALEAGETPQRLFVLPGWREAGFYSERERAALALAEEVTLISQGGVKDATFEAARAQFGDLGTVQLLMAINAINAWNRLVIATGIAPREAPARPAGEAAAPDV